MLMSTQFLGGAGTVVPAKEHEAGKGRRRDKGKQSLSALKKSRMTSVSELQEKNEPEVIRQ